MELFNEIVKFKKMLMNEFEMTDMRNMVQLKDSQSWLMKHLLQSRVLYQELNISNGGMFHAKRVYNAVIGTESRPAWRHLMFGNFARPRAVFIFWLVCNGRLATKARLKKYGMISEDNCCFCQEKETLNHLFFCCPGLKNIWVKVLRWIQVNHTPLPWDGKLDWLTRNCKGKSWRASLIKCAITEAIYSIWSLRNNRVFGHTTVRGDIDKEIIDRIVYRIWNVRKYRSYIAGLMT
ncbi:uncharacterized protein LOC131649040 [Vicia villosa]|uniref:uncharacterized protein LOC131649040 n=1 Tax=Vicia villosa TaxID=3911 RepID=UPI00273A8EB4|nr:uncharacterized protein LOC131649040 [Vicia villosa]